MFWHEEKEKNVWYVYDNKKWSKFKKKWEDYNVFSKKKERLKA